MPGTPPRREALLPESGKSIWNPAPPRGALPGIREVGLEPRGADLFSRWLSICPPDTGNVAGALSEAPPPPGSSWAWAFRHLGLQLWRSALNLGDFLLSPEGRGLVSGGTVLELGCGIGALGPI